MDIPDEWSQEFNLELYERTFDHAIKFHKEFPDTLWCWGNHDLSYVWEFSESGFSYYAINIVNRKLTELRNLMEYDDQIAYVQLIDDVMFSHGGVLDSFVKEHVSEKSYEDVQKTVDQINELIRYDMWRDDSPIWLRPQYGEYKMYKEKKILQIVGHTPVESIIKKRNLISCDVFSTYRDLSPIGTQEYLLIDTRTHEYSGIQCED